MISILSKAETIKVSSCVPLCPIPMEILPSTPLSTNHKSADHSKFNTTMSLVEKKCRSSKFPSHRHITMRRKAGINLNGIGLVMGNNSRLKYINDTNFKVRLF